MVHPALLGPGIQGEGEVGADGDGELELQPLASQRLAEVHALKFREKLSLLAAVILANYI